MMKIDEDEITIVGADDDVCISQAFLRDNNLVTEENMRIAIKQARDEALEEAAQYVASYGLNLNDDILAVGIQYADLIRSMKQGGDK